MIKKYKYIYMEQGANSEMFQGYPVYRIFNNRSKEQLGIISWYKPWKDYVFTSRDHCVFNNTCLRDVLDFMGNVIPTL